jgi:hypothetical protein
MSAKIAKMDPMTAKVATTAFARASVTVPDSDLPMLGNAVAQASLFAAYTKEGAAIKKTLYNVLSLLIYSAASCENPNKLYNGQRERMYSVMCDDDDELEGFDLPTLSKLVGKASKKTRDAVYMLAMHETKKLPISMPPIVKGAIEAYYGAAAFAPYFWPSGESEHGRDTMIYLSIGPLVRPVDHHLVYGGRIISNDVGTSINSIEGLYPASIWKCDIGRPSTIYTIDCRTKFMQSLLQLPSIIAVFMRNDRGSWRTL